ncbi:unannotated protein [freshwater metagenome]|uniref:Unannotated protein n=1 Tax=freshwater metagenome TaxID=449393 RepID=A0A6J6GU14_9ZZZZ
MEELIKMTDLWNHIKVVLLWRRVGHPLQGAGIPRIVGSQSTLLHLVCVKNVDEEQQNADTQDERTDGRNLVPKTKVE